MTSRMTEAQALALKSVLVWYDGPQIIEATDVCGRAYLGVLVDASTGAFFLAGVLPSALRRFRDGAQDLRQLMEVAPAGSTYLGVLDGDAIRAEPLLLVPEEYLPGAGFFFREERAAV